MILILNMTYYEIAMNFILYAFLGWCVEVAFHAITQGKVVNRGFLCGPICPVYGFGMLAVLAMANMLESNPNRNVQDVPIWILFIGGMILTTLIELVAGWLLEKHFHTRWWDYSKEKFNFHGYICLKFSIFWGIGVVGIVKLLHPILEKHTVNSIDPSIGWPVMAILYIALVVDWIVSISIVAGMNKRFKELNELQKVLMVPSDNMSEVIATNTMEIAQRVQEGKVQAALGKMELQNRMDEVKENVAVNQLDLKNKLDDARSYRMQEQAKRRELFEQKCDDVFEHFGNKRLLKAFPDMKWHENERLIPELKNRIEELRREKKK